MEKKTDRRGRVILREIPFTGIRQVIGQRMRQSLDTAPQGSVFARFDMSAVVALRESCQSKGDKVSFTDIMIKAVAAAAKECPGMNSALENDVITVYETVNVGIAVQVDDILVVPVINGADEKSLLEIAADTKVAIDNARNRRFDKLYMDGATITVNNLGKFYIDGCTPVINPPETAILGMGKIGKEAWVDENDQIVARQVATLSITINHAVVDGGQTGEFLGALKRILDSPADYIK